MAANLLNHDRNRLADVPHAALDETLRKAAGWPTAPPGSRPLDGPDATAA